MTSPGEPAGEIVIRRVRADESDQLLADVVALVVRSKASWGYDETFMEHFGASMVPGFLVGPRRVSLVASIAGTLVGVAVIDDEVSRAWLEDMWVEPEHFGHGVGRALWRAALGVVLGWRREALELESDPYAEGFYRAMGARRIGSRESTLVAGRELPLLRFDVRGPG